MTYSFHPEARVEFKEATLYYSEKSPSLAAAFYAEIEYAIEGIAQNPLLYNVVDEDVRRCLTKRFPYAIFYTIEDQLHSDTGRHALQQGTLVLETSAIRKIEQRRTTVYREWEQFQGRETV